jgi:acyl dehydratase
MQFTTSGRTVTEADIVAFAGLSGDFNPLHVDAEHAAQTIHKQRIAHGLLVLSVMSGLSTRLAFMGAIESTLIGLASLTCRWKRPTFIGDTLHIELEVMEKNASVSKTDRGTIILSRKAVNQRGETVLESDWALIIRKAG